MAPALGLANDEMQRTSHGQTGGSPLISVLGGRSQLRRRKAPAVTSRGHPGFTYGSNGSARYRRAGPSEGSTS